MANKFILIPKEIYDGLTAPNVNSSDPNLSYSKNILDNVNKLKIDPEKKNIVYNQELQRYRHLRKEKEDKPTLVKSVDEEVEILTDLKADAESPENVPSSSRKMKRRKKMNKERKRRSRAPSPESPREDSEMTKPEKQAHLNIQFRFKPRLWNLF
jgi:hypothetical protein